MTIARITRFLAGVFLASFLLPSFAFAQTFPTLTPSPAYDALNRLTAVSSLRSAPGGEAISSFTYDGEGKRVTSTEGAVTTTYLYDGLLPVLERQGGATTVNVWGLSLGGGIGGLLARVTPTGTFYPLYDGSGNVLAWTDSTGAVKGTVTYTAFGEVLSQSGSTQAVGFSTKSFSSATGLSYFGARYYSPSLARWLTPDPLGMVDGPNLYGYVQNNPINWFDPWGLKKAIQWPSDWILISSIAIAEPTPIIKTLLIGGAIGYVVYEAAKMRWPEPFPYDWNVPGPHNVGKLPGMYQFNPPPNKPWLRRAGWVVLGLEIVRRANNFLASHQPRGPLKESE